ncbi:hypothetical protein LTS18_000581, partial [Coniosporium uncinatum]
MTYYFGIPMDYADDCPATTLMFAFEIYGKREDIYETHFHSPAMKQFLTKIPPTMTTGLDLAHYESLGGFLDRPGDRTECGIMQDVSITCNSPDAWRTIAEKLKKLAEATEAAGDETVYTFMVFKSLDDETGLRIFGRYKDRDALKKHESKKEVIGFWMDTKDEIATMRQRCYVHN